MGDVGAGAQEGYVPFLLLLLCTSVFECHIFTLFMTIISQRSGEINTSSENSSVESVWSSQSLQS